MKKNKKLLIIMFTMSILLLVVTTGLLVEAQTEERSIKVGFPAPLSGSSAGWGESMVQGVTLAIEEINAAGGINGHKLELILGDVEGQDPGTVISVIRKLISRDKVDIMVTGAVNPSCVEYPLMQEMKMPYLLFAYAQTHELIVADNPKNFTYIHNCTTTYNDYKVQFADVVKMLEEAGKFNPINRNIAVIKSQNDYSIYCGDGLKETFKSRGWNIAIDETIPYGGRFTEFSPILAKIREYVPSVIIYTDHTSANAASFVREFLQDPTPSLVFLQATPSYPDFKEIMHGEQEGVIWTYAAPLIGPQASEYVKKFEKRWGKKPDPYGVFNYDVMNIAIAAMKKAKDPFDREEVNNILNSKDFSHEGIVGRYEFDDLQMAKYGSGFITFATWQEWTDKNENLISNTLFPLEFQTGDFNLPPWYETGLKKYGK